MRGLEGVVRGVSGRCGKRGPPRVVGSVAPRESLSEGRWGYPEGSGGLKLRDADARREWWWWALREYEDARDA